MYATRSHASALDENKAAAGKAAVATAEAKKAAAAGAGAAAGRPVIRNRKALGDIGNVVLDPHNKNSNNINKNNKSLKPPVPPLPPASRKPPRAAGAGDEAHHVRETAVALASIPSANLPVAYNTRSRAKAKKPTLTASLTAHSELDMHPLQALADCKEPLENIDEADNSNPLAVTEYVEDIYSFYRKTELHCYNTSDYLAAQTDINDKMRAILIDWLIEVHHKFKLMPETLFLTVNLIDRYLSCTAVSRKHLQLVGVTSMLLAAKYEEIWAPEVQDFIVISDEAYTRQQILAMEKTMLNTLSFNLTVPTPYAFLVRFLKAAKSNTQMDNLAFYLVELSLVEYAMVRFPPSLLAAAAVYVAQRATQACAQWNKVLQHHSRYTEQQLRECAGLVIEHHRRASSAGNLTVVYRKYASSKLNSVSLLTLASLD